MSESVVEQVRAKYAAVASSRLSNDRAGHLVTPQGHPGDAFLDRLMGELAHRFGIAHATVQIELGSPGVPCRLAPQDVV